MIGSLPSMLGFGPDKRTVVAGDLDAITTIGPEADPEQAGVDHAAVESIWASVRQWYRTGANPAIQICLRREGTVILNRSIGYSPHRATTALRALDSSPVTPDTPACVYSASKGITATVVHMLAERGAFGLDDRVCTYLPGFVGHGKDRITIQHLLDYSAGIPALPGDVPLIELIADNDRMRVTLESLRPLHRPGLRHIYHPVTAGLVLGAIVHAATGRRIRDVLADEILGPLGFRWTNYGVAQDDLPLVARCATTGRTPPASLSGMMRRSMSASLEEIVDLANDRLFLTTELPPANIVSTAAEMARFYEILLRGGELDGVRVMSPRTVRRAIAPRGRLLGVPGLRVGSGFVLGQRVGILGRHTETLFGHFGFTSVFAWADPARGLSGAIVPTGKSMTAGNIQLPLLLDRIAGRIPRVSRPLDMAGVRSWAA
ncbi:serine hydrolase domain-containing protein [Nocardia sp. NPDC004860]|uniref:serine hydrolase domain-containing protein n=1 Tax=Nocardia sp. NPDC004860 TaxID=3154557 RepID=UPI00339E5ED4